MIFLFEYDGEFLIVDRTDLQQLVQGKEVFSDKRSKICSTESLTVKIYVDKLCCEIIIKDKVVLSMTFYLTTQHAGFHVWGKNLKGDLYRS